MNDYGRNESEIIFRLMDDLLDKEFFINAAMPAKLEQRGEKITSDKVTTEIKDDKGEWSPMTFVKEGGAWKVSLE